MLCYVTNLRPRSPNVHPLLRKLKIENGSDREEPQISIFQQSRLKSDHERLLLLRTRLVRGLKTASVTIRPSRLITGEKKERGPRNTLNNTIRLGNRSRKRELVGEIVVTKHWACPRKEELEVFLQNYTLWNRACNQRKLYGRTWKVYCTSKQGSLSNPTWDSNQSLFVKWYETDKARVVHDIVEAWTGWSESQSHMITLESVSIATTS